MFRAKRRLTLREELRLLPRAPLILIVVAVQTIVHFFVPVPVKKAWARVNFWLDVIAAWLKPPTRQDMEKMIAAAAMVAQVQRKSRAVV